MMETCQETRITRTHDEDGSYETLRLPASETRNAVLGNVFICDGQPGQVLRIKAGVRRGSEAREEEQHHRGAALMFLYERRKELRDLYERMSELGLPR